MRVERWRYIGSAAALCLFASACPAPGPAGPHGSKDAGSSDAGSIDAGVGADTGPSIDPLSYAIDEHGPFAVGHRTREVRYEPLGDGVERTITVHFWYPAERAEGRHPRYLGLFTDAEVHDDAPAADPVHAGGYPVHIYSHGHLAYAGSSAFLVHHFASHGWVVVAPDHTDNTLADNVEPRPIPLYYHRPMDMSAALDALESLESGDPLARAATEEVVMSGHSYGAFTVWPTIGATYDRERVRAHCEMDAAEPRCTQAELEAFFSGLEDPRVVAALPMAGSLDPNWFGEDGHRGVDVPVVDMTGSEDDVGTAGQFERIEGIDYTWIDIEGGCHQTFAVGSCPNLDEEEGYRIVETFALALARRHVLGVDAGRVEAILEGREEVSERITYRSK
jgi:predicted dienelactone hydrolase